MDKQGSALVCVLGLKAEATGVNDFLLSLPSNSTILDVGCGNGKYLSVRKDDCIIHACDTCDNLINIAKEHNPHANIIKANGLDLPYESDTFDIVISIAVLHHLSTYEKQQKFISEILRVLKPDGKFYITVWELSAIKPKWVSIGINDYMVPWYNKRTNKTLMRYYHIFTYDEFQLLNKSAKITYELDNLIMSN